MVDAGNRNESDHFSKIIEDLKHDGVDFVYLLLGADQVIEFEKSSRKQGWSPVVMVKDGIILDIMLDYQGDIDPENALLAAAVYTTTLPETGYAAHVRKISRGIGTDRQQPGATLAGLGCESMSLLLGAMNRCEDISDRACINRMLHSTNDFQGLVGNIRIREDGKVERPIFINSIRDQKRTFVVKIY